MTQPGTTPEPVLTPGHLVSGAQPRLSSDGLTLRPWEEADAPLLVRAYSDPGIQRWHARTLSLRQASEWIAYELDRWQQEQGCSWAILGNDLVLGRIALGQLSLPEARAEVSYWVLPEARGRGVAPSALEAVAEWAFVVAGLHRLELHQSTQNPASCRAATKAGFDIEGTKRAQALHFDGWHDMHAHARLTSESGPASLEP